MKRRTPKLGQHFLKNPLYAKRLAEAVRVRRGEALLEIGPGEGVLTRELLATGAHVIAVEKDATLVKKLQETFAQEIESGQFTLIEDDVRNFNPRSLKLEARSYAMAANIPYYITGEILRMFLSAEEKPRTMALLVQKEVAERIIAADGKESILSLSVKAYGGPKIIAKVSRGNFSPPPSVDSAILVVENISRDLFIGIDEALFFKIVRAGFSSKRKLLLKNLANVFPLPVVRTAFKECELDEKTRAEDVPLEKWRSLAKRLSSG